MCATDGCTRRNPVRTGRVGHPARGYLCSCGRELPLLSELLYLCEIRLGTKKPGPTEHSVGPGFETSVLVVVVVLSVPPGDAAGAPPAWAAASSGPPPPLLARSGFGMRGQAAEPIPGGIAIVAAVVDEDAGTSGCVVPDVVADGGLKRGHGSLLKSGVHCGQRVRSARVHPAARFRAAAAWADVGHTGLVTSPSGSRPLTVVLPQS